MSDFNPQSLDATLATVITKIDGLHVTCTEIREEQRQVANDLREEHKVGLRFINGRIDTVDEKVQKVKAKVDTTVGKVVGAAIVVGTVSGLIGILLDHFGK